MTDNMHPSLDTLKQYALQPEAEEFMSLSLHLAGCLSCRQQLDVLVKITDAEDNLTDQCDEELLADIQYYLKEELTDNKDFEDKLNNNKTVMKAALRYACADSAMQRNAQNSVVKSLLPEKKSIFNLAQLFQYKAPLWFAFPAGAVASLLLAWLLMPMIQLTDTYQLVSYQDNPQIEFQLQNNMPGMGFFRSAKKQSQIYDSVDIVLLNDQQLQVQWPPVKNALSYTIKLYTFEKGEKRSLGKVSTHKLSAVFNTHGIKLKRRYEWVLSGLTSDHKQFNVSGGFIVY